MTAAAGTIAAAALAATVMASATGGAPRPVSAAADLAGAARGGAPRVHAGHSPATSPAAERVGQVLADAARQVLDQQRAAAHRAALRRVAHQAAARRAAAAKAAPPPPPATPQQMALGMLGNYGWSSSQFSCLDYLWARESGWNTYAANPSSGAYGIPQSLPGSKMASAGPDWQTNPATQIRWGLRYIQSIYGSPCGAWGHETSYGWY